MKEDGRISKKEKQMLEIALARAIDVDEEQALNERIEEYQQIKRYYDIFNIDSEFSEKIKSQIAEQGKGEFFQRVDPLNRLISSEDQLSDRKISSKNNTLLEYCLSDDRGREQLDKIIEHLGIDLEDLKDTDL